MSEDHGKVAAPAAVLAFDDGVVVAFAARELAIRYFLMFISYGTL